MLMNVTHGMSDDALVDRIAELAAAERRSTAELVIHLAELESRGLHLAMGFKSLYGYCRTVLHLSEHESYNRMEGALVARRFPVIVPLLADGRLHLTAVSLLGPHLGDENHLALIGGAIHKSKREVEELLARWFPKESVATSVRRVPVPVPPAPTAAPAAAAQSASSPDPATGPGGSSSQPAPAAPPADARTSRPTIAPLDVDRYAVKFTATAATIEKLRRAQDLLSHSVPSGDVAEIFDRALDALLESTARLRNRQVEKSRPKPAGARARRPISRGSRAIPADVEREVWIRDEGRCAYVAPGGRRCEERKFVELHHVKPWITGGPPTSDNIALRCAAHNAYEARLFFGPIRAAMEVRTRSGTS